MRHTLALLALTLFLVGIGIYVLLLPQEARGQDCGGRPLPVLVGGAGGEAVQKGLDKDCSESAAESVGLGFGVIGCGLVGAVAVVALAEGHAVR